MRKNFASRSLKSSLSPQVVSLLGENKAPAIPYPMAQSTNLSYTLKSTGITKEPLPTSP